MAVTPYAGTLNANEIYSAIYNMIISQLVFSENVKGTYSTLADRFRVDGSAYGDTLLRYFTDALPTHKWGKDAEAASLLSLDRAPSPFCQKLTITEFRLIRLTLDDYMTKRAWSTEGAFSQFNSVMQGWIGDVKRIYDSTLVNNYVGSTTSALNGQTITISPVTDASTDVISVEAKNRLEAEAIAKQVADTFVDLTNINRINDLGYLKSYSKDDLIVVWNAEIANKVKKFDMPTLFHKEGLIDKFEEVVLPENYFANVTAATEVIGTYAAGTGTLYANEEMDVRYKYSSSFLTKHYFPGEEILKTQVYGANTYTATDYTDDEHSTAATSFRAGDVKKPSTSAGAQVVCKIVHKDSLPFMSSFETRSEFYNPRSLTTNNYLTYSHNTLQYLYGLPWVTIKI